MTRINDIMKRILITAAAIIAAALSANAQQVDTIKISNITTTHIRFSSEIKYVDLSNKVLAAKIVEGSRDIIALKAKEPFDFITTMSCLEANGAMHTYLVQFEEYPKQLVIEEGSSNRPVASEKPQSSDSGNFSETPYPTSSNLPANASVLEQALQQPKSLYHIGSKAYGISIFCDNVFIKDDIMYVVLNIENKSATTYSLSEPRFSIESKKRTKRGLVYEKQIFPKNILGMELVAPSTQSRMVCKKQEKARQKEAILRYLDSIETITNAEARELLKLPEKDRSKVSRLFAELVAANEIVQTEDGRHNHMVYSRLKKA